MRRAALMLGLTLALGACRADESVAAYGAGETLWQLVRIDGAPFEAHATMRFGESGAVFGQAPCNSFSARQSAPYPWFELGPIRATKRACPDLEAEARFFASLGEMTLSEVSGTVLVLSNDAGRSMEFRAENGTENGAETAAE
ncbi:META domain-containing protein [Primorskyibacter sp. S187A]|uniref:META domain-containing protein n=1 Tax=Primorskyibacter sp. S187A TaxID=3415130 RepID=UPI003C7CFAD4